MEFEKESAIYEAVGALLGESSGKTSALAIVKEVSAAVNRLTSEKGLDLGALSITAGLLWLCRLSSGKFEIAAGRQDLGALKDFYPILAGVSFRPFAKILEMVVAVAGNEKLVGSAPIAKTKPSDVWWTSMLAENKAARIIGRLPLVENGSGAEHYLIAREGSAFGFDRSVIAIATSESVTAAWLKAALHKLRVPLFRVVDMVAVAGGAVLHLVELSHPITSMSNGIFKLAETMNGVAIRTAGYLGGYYLPIVDKGKIVEFKK
ncbi:MAG: hypothetical protein LBL52_00410 [Rickettsiales bacterium]|jgi:hypothetical protein|nr:hypothetical protein [Rickettsiales bacterium]